MTLEKNVWYKYRHDIDGDETLFKLVDGEWIEVSNSEHSNMEK